MEFDLESHLSRVVLGESAVPASVRPGTPARPIPGRGRPVSVHGVQSLSSSLNSPSPFPNLLSSLTERPQPLSPTTTIANSKTPASRYIRPARCLTDSILSSSSSIDSLLGKSAPRTPPPATAPPPTPPVVAAPVSSPPAAVAATTIAAEDKPLEPAASLEAPVDTVVAASNPKPSIQDPAPGDSPSQSPVSGSVQKPNSNSITENPIASVVPEQPDLQEPKRTQSLVASQKQITVSIPAAVESLPETPPQTPAKAVEATAQPLTKQSAPPPVSPSPPAALPSPPPVIEQDTSVPAPRALDTPPPTPSRKVKSSPHPAKPTSTETQTPEVLAPLPEEGDSFRDFREPPKSVSTLPPSLPPSTSRPAFGRLSFGSSFSSLVLAVTSATAQSNMGLTGDGRSKANSGQNSGFGGWLQKRASGSIMTGTETKGEDESGGIMSNRSRSASTASKLTIGKENLTNGINGSSNMPTTPLRSTASSFVEGSSRPTTPQKSPSAGPALMSPTRQITSPLKSIPEPPHPACVNEFQGLSFPMLINSFRTPVQSKSPDHCEHLSAEDRLEELANMAQNLLERIYTAYTKRTKALEEVLVDQSVLKEEVEERKVKARHLQSQLDRVSQDAEKVKEEKDEVIGILVKELEIEKVKMEEERREWEDERQKWREIEREKIRAELLMEMLAAQGGSGVTLEDGEGDAEMTPRKKRVSTGGASSDSGFDESDKSDSDSFYSMAKGEAAGQNGSAVGKKPSLASIATTSTVPSTPIRAARPENGGEKSGKMVPPPLLNPAPISVVRCENCSRMSFTSRPSSPSPSIKSLSSPPPVVSGSVNQSRFPTSVSKNPEPPQQPSAPSSATSATATSSRWGFGVLRGNNNGAQTQQELDRLRGENKNLRERVGDLEKSVDDVLGVLGGWRS